MKANCQANDILPNLTGLSLETDQAAAKQDSEYNKENKEIFRNGFDYAFSQIEPNPIYQKLTDQGFESFITALAEKELGEFKVLSWEPKDKRFQMAVCNSPLIQANKENRIYLAGFLAGIAQRIWQTKAGVEDLSSLSHDDAYCHFRVQAGLNELRFGA